MSKTYRAGNGKFVRSSNPVAVIGRLREAKQRERNAALDALTAESGIQVTRRGYKGPLTREELAGLQVTDSAE